MKRLISMILSIMMVMCFMPSLAFADDSTPYDLSSSTVTIPALTYNGSEQTPIPTVSIADDTSSDPAITLTSGAIYTVSYEHENGTTGAGIIDTSKVKNAGTYTATFNSVSGASIGSTTVSFTVAAKSIDSSGITATIPDQVSGAAITASAVTVKDGNKTLVAGTDYTIEAVSPSTLIAAAGTNKINIKGLGNYTGMKALTYHAGKGFIISNESSIKSYAYNIYSGNAIEPSVTIKDGSTTLTKDTHYTVKYSNNINAGTNTGTITVTGKGTYGGVQTVNFTIKPISLSTSNLKIYNTVRGENPKVYYNNKQLSNAECLVSKTEIPSSSSAYATVTLSGNYTLGAATSNTTQPAQLSGKISYTVVESAYDITGYNYYSKLDQVSYMYTGSPIIPTATLKNSSGSYLSSSYYTIFASNNTKVGSATATIVGIGAYGGSFEKTFPITALDLSKCTVTLGTSSYVYTGTAKTPTVTVRYGNIVIPSSDYTVTYSNNIYTGTATATVTASSSGNCYSSNKATFTITGTDINKCSATLSPSSYNYTGYAQNPSVTVKYGTKTLVNGTDYTVAYSNNIKAGMATATITGKGGYSGTMELNYTIEGKANSIITNASSYSKYQTSSPFYIGATSLGDETGFAYKSSDVTVATVNAAGMVTIVGTGKATLTVTTVGTSAFNPVSKNIVITVKPSKVTPKLYSTSKKTMRVRVTKKPGVTKYQIRYGRAGVYKYTYITYADNQYTTQSKLIKGLKSGYKYYVKVRPYKLASDGTKVYGNWSSTKSIRIK